MEAEESLWKLKRHCREALWRGIVERHCGEELWRGIVERHCGDSL